jgi:AcrR family transcriptional regulator
MAQSDDNLFFARTLEYGKIEYSLIGLCMLRSLNTEKREAILNAAVRLIAERGLAATRTSAISKEAGIAEGTLFTYFRTKDELVEALYVKLKLEMVGVMVEQLPHEASVKDQLRFIWDAYVDWGITYPEKRRASAQLHVAPAITSELRATASAPLAPIEQLIRDSIEHKILRDYPVSYLGATLVALAETTMGFMLSDPDSAGRYRQFGFEMLWSAIAHS